MLQNWLDAGGPHGTMRHAARRSTSESGSTTRGTIPTSPTRCVIERKRRSHRSIKYLVYFAGMVADRRPDRRRLRRAVVPPPGQPVGRSPAPVEVFKVLPTDTVETISERLQDRGLITNARVFRYYVDHNGGLVLTPGDYELRATRSHRQPHASAAHAAVAHVHQRHVPRGFHPARR